MTVLELYKKSALTTKPNRHYQIDSCVNLNHWTVNVQFISLLRSSLLDVSCLPSATVCLLLNSASFIFLFSWCYTAVNFLDESEDERMFVSVCVQVNAKAFKVNNCLYLLQR